MIGSFSIKKTGFFLNKSFTFFISFFYEIICFCFLVPMTTLFERHTFCQQRFICDIDLLSKQILNTVLSKKKMSKCRSLSMHLPLVLSPSENKSHLKTYITRNKVQPYQSLFGAFTKSTYWHGQDFSNERGCPI